MASQAKEILITFVLPVKAAEEPKHQYTAIIGLDFEQSVRVLADPSAVQLGWVPPDYQLEVTDLLSSEAINITSKTETKTLLDFNKYVCQRLCQSENLYSDPSE